MTYFFADVEATSIYPITAELLTADFIKCDSQLNVIEERGFKFRPRQWSRDAEEAVRIHGITRDHAMTFPGHEQSSREMINWLLEDKERSYLVCHVNRIANRTYDAIILRMIALDYGYYFDFGIKFRESDYISTHSLAKYAKVSCALDLASLAKYFNIKQAGHHTSKDDVRVCYEIFKKLVQIVDINDFLKGDINGEFKETKKRTTKKSSSSVYSGVTS